MHEISSLLSLSNDSAISCFAAFSGSLIFFAMSTASWLAMTWINYRQNKMHIYKMLAGRGREREMIGLTFHKPSLARMRKSVSTSISAGVTSGSDRRCVFRFLSPKARETASWPFTLATSPDIMKWIRKMCLRQELCQIKIWSRRRKGKPKPKKPRNKQIWG